MIKFKRKFKLKTISAAALIALTICFGACADQDRTGGEQTTSESLQEQTDNGNQAASDATGSDAGSSSSAEVDKALGEWVMVYYRTHSEYEDEQPYDYVTMCTDPDSPESSLKISRDGDRLIADYRYSYMEGGSDRFYGNQLVYRDQPAYEGCENSEWSLAFTMPFEEDEEKYITLIDDDTLIRYEVYETDKDELGDNYYYYRYETTSTYLRKDSPRLQDPEQLRYFDTVTVSDAKTLLNSIENNTKILLDAGTYDFTDIPADEVDNQYVQYRYGEYAISGVSNLCIEAKKGAEVLICVADPYTPVLSFSDGTNISLRGLTVGHDVEPGTCSGSVLYYSGINGVTIDDCRLYGSGTYGVEADYCYRMNVTDSEIYECTYGLISMTGTGDTLFQNCELRDSGDLAMFSIDGSYGLVFEDCRIHDNTSASLYGGVFVELANEYDSVTFRNCEFTNNTYRQFSNYSVNLEQCTIKDNVG